MTNEPMRNAQLESQSGKCELSDNEIPRVRVQIQNSP